MSSADRLTVGSTVPDSGIPIAPSKVGTEGATDLYTDALNLDGSTSSGDGKNVLRPEDDPVYDASSLAKDIRSHAASGAAQGRVVYVDSDAAGSDTFVLKFHCDIDAGNSQSTVKGTADADGIFATSSLNDDDSAATIQTAIRAALPGTDLTVVEGNGPDFYIIFDRDFWPRRYPRVEFVGTGCTATITVPSESDQDAYGTTLISARDAEIGALGESRRVSASDDILRPTIGTITVTDGTDEIQSVTYSAGNDGGSWGVVYSAAGIPGVRAPIKGRAFIPFDATVTEAQAFLNHAFGADKPTFAYHSGLEQTGLHIGTITTGDTFKVKFGATDKSGAITYASDMTTDLQAAYDTYFGANEYTVTRASASEYDVVKQSPGAGPVIDITDETNAHAGTASVESAATDCVVYLTYESGELAGRPVGLSRNGISAADDLMTDGGVAEPNVVAVVTPGVLGSASAAYTERGSGSDILAAAVRDRDGKTYGFVNDAATPVVFTSLPPGTYHMVARTVEDKRVSKATSKAFTVAST